MKEFSYFPGKIDHEVRYFPLDVASNLVNSEEPVFFQKIAQKCNLQHGHECLSDYLSPSYLDGCVLRSLPLNNSTSYINATKSLIDYALSLDSKNFRSSSILPLPNPNLVSIDDFRIFLSEFTDTVIGYELISSWHGLNLDDPMYTPYINLVLENNLELCLETDHSFRASEMHLFRAINIIKRHSLGRVWLPHLGCGAFLYPQIFEPLNVSVILLTSVPLSFALD